MRHNLESGAFRQPYEAHRLAACDTTQREEKRIQNPGRTAEAIKAVDRIRVVVWAGRHAAVHAPTATQGKPSDGSLHSPQRHNTGAQATSVSKTCQRRQHVIAGGQALVRLQDANAKSVSLFKAALLLRPEGCGAGICTAMPK